MLDLLTSWPIGLFTVIVSWWSTTSLEAKIWVGIGFGAQAIFASRFLVQWIYSERAKRSVIPPVFWYLSIVGGLTLLAYAIYRQDPVIILGQLLGVFVYARNIYYLWLEKRQDPSDPASASAKELPAAPAPPPAAAATGAITATLIVAADAATATIPAQPPTTQALLALAWRWIAASEIRACLVVLAVGLAVVLPGLDQIPPLDRDEARFAQASKQMLESGDFIDIRFQDAPRHNKPVGIYWLQTASVAMFANGVWDQVWAYRLPSAIGALLALFGCYMAGRCLFDRTTGLVAALGLAATVMLAAEAHIAKTDAMLLASVCWAQAALLRLWFWSEANRAADTAGRRLRAWQVLFWGMLGFGVLLKGPITPMVAAFTLITLTLCTRRGNDGPSPLRRLGWRFGPALALAVAAPWFIAIVLKSGGGFVAQSVGGDLLPKLLSGVESHGAPPGLYLLISPLTLWPLVIGAIPALRWAWRERRDLRLIGLLGWLIPSWLLFELVPTKLPHYVLPVVPALAIIIAAWLAREGHTRLDRIDRIAIAVGLGAGAVLAFGLLLAAPLALSTPPPAGAMVAVAVLLVGLGLTIRQLRRGWRLAPAAALLLITALGTFGSVFQWAMPGLTPMWVAPRLLAAAEIPVGDTRPIASVGFSEPSLIFLAGTDTQLLGPADAAAALSAGTVTRAVIEERHLEAFKAAAAAQTGTVALLAQVNGYNYSRGKWLTFHIFRQELAQP